MKKKTGLVRRFFSMVGKIFGAIRSLINLIVLAVFIVIIASLALSQLHSPYWLIFTAFVGLNLFQSAFSNWCPMITFLRKLGVKEG